MKTTNTSASYKAHNGITYTHEDFINSLLYSPTERREIEAHNSLYYAAMDEDRKKMKQAEDDKKYPKIVELSEDDYYQLAVKEDARKKVVQAQMEATELKRLKDRAAFLKSSPEFVHIVANTPPNFTFEYAHWVKKGYVEIEGTLQFSFPSLFTVHMTRNDAFK